jgi:uncharacterized protein
MPVGVCPACDAGDAEGRFVLRPSAPSSARWLPTTTRPYDPERRPSMTAERMPPSEASFLAAPLGLVTRAAVRFPVATLVAAVVLAVLALLLAHQRLGFRTSRLDLLNPESGYNRLWIDYIDEFGDEDDAVIVVEGRGREQIVPVLEELSHLLSRQQRLFHAVLHQVDLSTIRAKGLHYLSTEQLATIEGFLDRAGPVLTGDWSQLQIGVMLERLCDRLEQELSAAAPGADHALVEYELVPLAQGLLGTLARRGDYQSPWPEMPHAVVTLSESDSNYLLTSEGRLGFVLLRLADDGQLARYTTAIVELRRLIQQVSVRHPDVRIGLTGLPVMENDEMHASQSSMLKASVISLVGVACLFMAGFGGVRHPLLTVAALLLALAWSFGYITLAVGHLNILSVAFSVILIGLGIDFGVHYTARYLSLRSTIRRSEAALVETARSVGPGTVTGGVTTAIAFFTAGLTQFTGIAELGVIAGGGILLCIVAALVVLPAMIQLADRNTRAAGRDERPARQRSFGSGASRVDLAAAGGAASPIPAVHGEGMRTCAAKLDSGRGDASPGASGLPSVPEPLPIDAWLAPLWKRPWLLLAASLLVSMAAAAGCWRLWYDHNLLNLQPEGLESVELERKLLAESDQSVWFALSLSDSRDELLARKERFLQLASVQRTEEIVSLLPPDHEHRQPVIARIHERLAALPERPPLIAVDRLEELGGVLARASQLAGEANRTGAAVRLLEQIRDALRRLPPSECFARLSDFQQGMAGDLLTRLYTLRGVSNPEPPNLADLPQSLVTRFVGHGGRHLLKIYGRGNIWDMQGLERFVFDVKSVDPAATGQPLQTYYASRQMQQSYVHAALYALLAVSIVLLLDFGRLRWCLLSMVPMAVGMAIMLGLMGWLDIPLNPANMIVLPLILGIGLDDGVHVVHDFRRQRAAAGAARRTRAVPGRADDASSAAAYRPSWSTLMAVLITSLTTMVGFGSLMICEHRGLESLGRTLVIGVSCCLFTSLVMLPALLHLISRGRPGCVPSEAEAAIDEPGETLVRPMTSSTVRR